MFEGILIFFISLIIFSFRLNAYPLFNWDEAWYAEISRNLSGGKYGFILPHWNGEYFFDKPPLYFWLSYPFVHFFENGEWRFRIISVLAGAFTVLFVYLIGKQMFGLKTGIVSTLIFVSFGQIVSRFSMGNLDSLMIGLFLASFFFFLGASKSRKYLVTSGILWGLSLLVKGWLLGLFPLGLMILYAIAANKRWLEFVFRIVVIGLLTVGWWWVAGAVIYGTKFTDWYVFKPAAGNFGSSTNYWTTYYLTKIVSDISLWTILAVVATLVKKPSRRAIVAACCLLGYCLFYFVGLHFSADKFDWYLLPAYPLIAIGLGSLISNAWNRNNKLFLSVIVFVFANQIILAARSIYFDPDRSRVGADLGRFVKERLEGEEKVVLDDADFPAFIFYSELGRVEVLTESGKPNEYWMIKRNELKKPVWIVTKNWRELELGLPKKIIVAPHNYNLVYY